MHPGTGDVAAWAPHLFRRHPGPNPHTAGDLLNPLDNDTSKMRQQLRQTAMIAPARPRTVDSRRGQPRSTKAGQIRGTHPRLPPKTGPKRRDGFLAQLGKHGLHPASTAEVGDLESYHSNARGEAACLNLPTRLPGTLHDQPISRLPPHGPLAPQPGGQADPGDQREHRCGADEQAWWRVGSGPTLRRHGGVFDSVEWAWLTDPLDQIGPDAPALLAPRTSGDIAAHLVVLREREPGRARGERLVRRCAGPRLGHGISPASTLRPSAVAGEAHGGDDAHG